MKVFIRTKSGKEYLMDTEYKDMDSFMRDKVVFHSDTQWLHLGKIQSNCREYEPVIRIKDIEVFGFNLNFNM